MGSTRTTLLFRDKPLFGLDIGTGSIKVMQVDGSIGHKKLAVTGYGMTLFDAAALNDGEIVKAEVLAKATRSMFEHHLIGDITTRRVAISVPAFRTYTHELQLPNVSQKELQEAVMTEAEQYIPRSLEDLYIDYTVTSKTAEEMSVYIVAIPKKIIDSYYNFARLLGLEVVLIEPSILSATRVLSVNTRDTLPSVLVDFGTLSADVSIYESRVIVTGTVQAGSELFAQHIMQALDVSHQEAELIKAKYGISLSKKQAQIQAAVEPLLKQTTREVKRMMRYYEERMGGEKKIEQVITMGGGANMPGLTDYLTAELRLPTRMIDPWQMLDFGKLQPPNYAERSIYMTVAGLALISPKEVLA